jgi:glucose 1-dehydrogenase
MEKPNTDTRAGEPARSHAPDYQFIQEQFPEPEMPACPTIKVLKGQKAIVTGGSSGIGKGIAIALGHAGCDVLVNYASKADEAEKVAEEIRRCGPNAITWKTDVSKEDQVQEMFRRATDAFGTLDILINNAGLQKDAPFVNMTLSQWQQVIDVNLTGQFLCAREAVRIFQRQGVRKDVSCAAGKIVCISSVHDVIPWAGHVNYAASKGGISMMMKSIAQEVAPYRIRVNSVSPGAIRTPINMEAWDTAEAYQALLKLIPSKRIGEPNEIGRAAVWLASDDSDYVHGTTLYVDGGMTLYPGFETGG